MYCTRKINADYTWVGADCRRLALFEGVFGVPDGVSFNSCLLMDDKTVLFDTVDSAVGEQGGVWGGRGLGGGARAAGARETPGGRGRPGRGRAPHRGG